MDEITQGIGALRDQAFATGYLILFITGLARRWWVMKSVVDDRDATIAELKAERDMWRRTALNALNLEEEKPALKTRKGDDDG